jgi:7-cyano-7-deazaguanine synthase
MSNCVAILSGGLDSTTLVYHLFNEDYIPHCLSFNYGQRHSKELDFAWHTADRLDLQFDEIDLTSITGLISNSALTHGKEVPDGHYAEENMKQTVVPNRNMIMLSIAAGVAVSNKYKFVAAGMHAGDHFVYPDCRPEFIDALSEAVLTGNEGFHNFAKREVQKFSGVVHYREPIYTPFIHKTKADIAYRALELGVPLDTTWSCYRGKDVHCGRCGTCVERLEAIAEAQQRAMETELNNGNLIEDKTVYADKEYWRTVTNV